MSRYQKKHSPTFKQECQYITLLPATTPNADRWSKFFYLMLSTKLRIKSTSKRPQYVTEVTTLRCETNILGTASFSLSEQWSCFCPPCTFPIHKTKCIQHKDDFYSRLICQFMPTLYLLNSRPDLFLRTEECTKLNGALLQLNVHTGRIHTDQLAY